MHGSYDLILADDPEIYAFTRTLDDQRLVVILNFNKSQPVFTLPESISFSGCELVISNYSVDPTEDIRRFTLRPYEARVHALSRTNERELRSCRPESPSDEVLQRGPAP